MPKKSTKKSQLAKLKPNRYRIYGIFDFTVNELVYVNMDVDQTEMEFDIGDYDPERHDIVSFDLILT